MKSVATFRQKPEAFFLFKDTQTNRAIRVDQVVFLSVLEHLDGVDHGLIQTDGVDQPNGMKQHGLLIGGFICIIVNSPTTSRLKSTTYFGEDDVAKESESGSKSAYQQDFEW
ncbi:hypothetical protein HanXRQr2_Chr12g0555511 [Helianthus annuus]|uniref:Uncharacterized protein n=1 Tax=Helianthus annuus TaxID=4232 RepID=A0A9K3HIV1_HELAN|nr:hypothetical protein HanXRQr2_Chr12g0555511 [Helianthus annuus]KAJ0494629.1 hypothetical protein HanIR_Chr12g0599621 [Helianthus annuus]